MAVTVEIGILTKGKPTLSMVLASLLLQQMQQVRIHIVDTGEKPVINRDDVVFALRLAFDREIVCTYERIREKDRAFSIGRLKLLESLTGKYVCFMDDDVVMSSLALERMADAALQAGIFGYIAPNCKNAGFPVRTFFRDTHHTPGSIFYQDDVVRSILTDYYGSTVDVLDRKRDPNKVWEIAFLTEMFDTLGRRCIVQHDNVSYHLDYKDRVDWTLLEDRLVKTSIAKAHELVEKHAAPTALVRS